MLQELELGPNGGLVYCMDYLEKNIDWLLEAMQPFEKGARARYDIDRKICQSGRRPSKPSAHQGEGQK